MTDKKVYVVGFLTLFFSLSHSAHAEQGIDLGSGWLFSGDLRTGYVTYNYDNPNGDAGINRGHKDSQGFYFVPKLSIETPTWGGFSAKITGAGASDFGLNNPEKESRNFIFDANDLESFAILQEAYITYSNDNAAHSALVGRNELYTPMIDTDDWYMLANSFEVAAYTNRSITNLMITGGYLHKMAGVWDSGANGTEFHSMSDSSFVSSEDKIRANDNGVGYLAAQYDNGTHNAQIWGYHATDLYNILFTQYDFSQTTNSGFSYDIGIQFIGFKENGELADHATTNIDYGIYSARFDGSFANGIGFATGIAKFSDGEGQGATLGAWGGYPYFANGMIFHFFEAGSLQNAASYKFQGSYDFSKIGLEHLNLAIRYTYFDLDPEYSISSTGEKQDAMELIGFSISYDFLEGGYVSAKYEHHDTDGEPGTFALRLIGGYRF
jgi:outer membrane porin, OprD family